MKRKTFLIVLPILLTLGLIVTPALAKENQTNGTPFQELWEAIQDLQAQINNIVLTPGLEGPQGPQGEPGPQGPPGAMPFAGQVCPEGQFVIGFDDEGNIICGSIDSGAEGKVVINEVYYDSPFGDGPNVFTEIFGPAGMSLDGWTLDGINGATGLSYRIIDLAEAVIPADGLLVIARDDAVGPAQAARDFVADVDWQNGPDAVLLVDPEGNTVDALQYGDAGTNNAGEGIPAPDINGASLSRDAAHTDTDDNASDFSITSPPTPGAP